jgi:hypothetical protein
MEGSRVSAPNHKMKCGLLASALLVTPVSAHAFCMTPQEYVKARPRKVDADSCMHMGKRGGSDWHVRFCPDGQLAVFNYLGVPERPFTIELARPGVTSGGRRTPSGRNEKLETTYIEAQTRKLIIIVEDGAAIVVIMNNQTAPPATCVRDAVLDAAAVETSLRFDVVAWRRFRQAKDY